MWTTTLDSYIFKSHEVELIYIDQWSKGQDVDMTANDWSCVCAIFSRAAK
jgi:hypothetical protein